MTIDQGILDQFGIDLFNGVHDFSLDTFKVALYLPSASLDPTITTTYTTSGESSGTGYSAGGLEATIVAGFPKVSGPVGARKIQVDFDDVTFSSVTLSTRGSLLYNDTAAGKPAVMIIDFGSLLVAAAQPIRVRMPDPSSLGAALEMQIQRG